MNLSMIDLAGSGLAQNMMINDSKKVPYCWLLRIVSMNWEMILSKHIPHRDSNMTRIIGSEPIRSHFGKNMHLHNKTNISIQSTEFNLMFFIP